MKQIYPERYKFKLLKKARSNLGLGLRASKDMTEFIKFDKSSGLDSPCSPGRKVEKNNKY